VAVVIAGDPDGIALSAETAQDREVSCIDAITRGVIMKTVAEKNQPVLASRPQ
jgi:hypothetical protein